MTGGLRLAIARERISFGLRTFPTAASPSRTSLTLLLGLGAVVPAESVIDGEVVERYKIVEAYSAQAAFSGSDQGEVWLVDDTVYS